MGQVTKESNYATQTSNKLTISTINPLNLPHGGLCTGKVRNRIL